MVLPHGPQRVLYCNDTSVTARASGFAKATRMCLADGCIALQRQRRTWCPSHQHDSRRHAMMWRTAWCWGSPVSSAMLVPLEAVMAWGTNLNQQICTYIKMQVHRTA